jgi:DNA-directed RNA polymerase specialized sigma subunit
LIGKEVTKLPVKSRTIMDLFLVNQMTVNEIASVKKIPEQEVECIIEQVSKDLKKKLISKL